MRNEATVTDPVTVSAGAKRKLDDSFDNNIEAVMGPLPVSKQKISDNSHYRVGFKRNPREQNSNLRQKDLRPDWYTSGEKY